MPKYVNNHNKIKCKPTTETGRTALRRQLGGNSLRRVLGTHGKTNGTVWDYRHICNPSLPLVIGEVERRDSSNSSLASTATETRESLPQNKEENTSSSHAALLWHHTLTLIHGKQNKIKNEAAFTLIEALKHAATSRFQSIN